jgi:hypothetical protein
MMHNVGFIPGSIGFFFYGESGRILLGPPTKDLPAQIIMSCSLIIRPLALFSLSNYYKVNQLSLILQGMFLLKYGPWSHFSVSLGRHPNEHLLFICGFNVVSEFSICWQNKKTAV